MLDFEISLIALMIVVILVLALATLAVNLLFPGVGKRD